MEFFAKTCALGLIAALSLYMLARVGSVSATNTKTGAERMHTLIERALVQSFALDGAYPSDKEFEAVMNKYGISLDRERFIFHYHAFSSNILPEFRVIAI